MDGGSDVERPNTFAVGLTHTPERWQRHRKHQWVVHAEHGAILAAAAAGRATTGATLYAPWYACEGCALAIVAAGITRVVGHTPFRDHANGVAPHWNDSVAHGLEVLAEAGVRCDWVDVPLVGAPPVRINGGVFHPDRS